MNFPAFQNWLFGMCRVVQCTYVLVCVCVSSILLRMYNRMTSRCVMHLPLARYFCHWNSVWRLETNADWITITLISNGLNSTTNNTITTKTSDIRIHEGRRGWMEATTTKPKTAQICGATSGNSNEKFVVNFCYVRTGQCECAMAIDGNTVNSIVARICSVYQRMQMRPQSNEICCHWTLWIYREEILCPSVFFLFLRIPNATKIL